MADPMIPAPRKFAFDTEFGSDGGVTASAAPFKRFYTPEEVERLTAKAVAEAEARSLASIEGRTAHALEGIALVTRAALGSLAQSAHEHRVSAAELALA